ncbi:MAG: MarR family winged helix-turn-helix transcriptional regulator [Pseudomonadota bacterium]
MYAGSETGLGTQLRLLLAHLDGELAALYKQAGHEFRPRFYPVFQLLLDRDGALVSDIAHHLRTSQPAATQTLAEMTRLDLVFYETGKDRRERIVKLTPHALKVAQDLEPIWDAVGRAASQLDGELSHPLSAILNEALAALERTSFPERIALSNTSQGD